MSATPPRLWASGDAYEPYVGRWSRLVAREFLAWLGRAARRALARRRLRHRRADRDHPRTARRPRRWTGIDAVRRLRRPRRGARRRPARDLRRSPTPRRCPSTAGAFDAAVSGLVLNFVPEPPRWRRRCAGSRGPGGTVAALRVGLRGRDADDAALLGRRGRARSRPRRELDEGARFPICRPEPLRRRCSRAPGSTRSRRAPSTSRPSSATSTTTGRRSSAARRRRPAYCMSLDRRAPRRAARGAARPPARPARRQHPADRPRVGRARHRLAAGRLAVAACLRRHLHELEPGVVRPAEKGDAAAVGHGDRALEPLRAEGFEAADVGCRCRWSRSRSARARGADWRRRAPASRRCARPRC